MPSSSVTFGAQQAGRPIVLQYQSVVGPFTSVQPQAAPDRPGASSGGALAYRPTLIQYQSLTGPPGSFVAPPLPRGWATVFGQQIYLKPQAGVSWVAPLRVADVTQAVVAGAWKGLYPDRLVRLESARAGVAEVSWAAALPFQDPSRFGWRGVAPDRLDRRGLLPGAQRFQALESPVQYPIPGVVSWLPQTPAWLRAAQPLTVRDAFVQNLDPIVNPPSPELAWQGWQPSRLDRPRRVAEFSPYTQPPKMIPFVPDLVGGLAVYPDWLRRPGLLSASQRVWTDRFNIVIPDLRRDWSPVYPDLLYQRLVRGGVAGGANWAPSGNPSQLPTDWRRVGPDQLFRQLRPVLTPVSGVTAPPATTIFIGELMAWEPDRVYFPYPQPRWADDYQAIILNPLVPGGGIPCVEIVRLVATVTCLSHAHATETGLLQLAATVTEGTGLDWC